MEEPIEIHNNTTSFGIFQHELGYKDGRGVNLDEQTVKWDPTRCESLIRSKCGLPTNHYVPRMPTSMGVEVDSVSATGEYSGDFVDKPVSSGSTFKSIADPNTSMAIKVEFENDMLLN